MADAPKKLAVKYLPTESLVPYARNARTDSEAQIEKIAASIKEFGFNNPVLLDGDKGLIAGHGRLEAAKTIGLARVPTIEISHLTDAQKRAYILADNRLAEDAAGAGWDMELLKLEFDDLGGLGIDTDLLGFDHDFFGTDDGETGDDELPEPPKTPVTVLGDLWLLGPHRVICGDATSEEDVERLLSGTTPQLCLTDPPYGIGDSVTSKNNYLTYEDTKENLLLLIDKFLPLARERCGVVVLTPGNSNQQLYPTWSWSMAWFVPAGIGRGPWGFCCWQPMLCYGKDPKLAKGKGSHPDAIVYTESAGDVDHPCPKPVKFWRWLVDRTSERGDLIYDPFLGSGTTVIAAQTEGRVCYGLELDPIYCDVIVKRWQDFTGESATLDGTGQTFEEVAASRLVDQPSLLDEPSANPTETAAQASPI